MTDLSSELRERLAAKPDQFTLAWWEERFQEVLKGYRGATHGINLALSECEDVHKEIKDLQAQIKLWEQDRAKIGELQARVERMAEFLTKLKQGDKP
jgi:phage-related tail protein